MLGIWQMERGMSILGRKRYNRHIWGLVSPSDSDSSYRTEILHFQGALKWCLNAGLWTILRRSKVLEHMLSDWLKLLAFGLDKTWDSILPLSVSRWLTLGKLFNLSEVSSSVTITYLWGYYLSMCFLTSLRMTFMHKEDFSGTNLVSKITIQFN